MPRALLIVFLVALALGPSLASAEIGVFFERRVERLIATPTPVGPLTIASDQARWIVDVPASAVVFVEAQSSATAPMYLRARPEAAPDSAFLFPTTHAGFLLSTPGKWRVSVDPAGGVSVDIRVRFQGFVADHGGGPAPFTLTSAGADRGCVVPGVCLP